MKLGRVIKTFKSKKNHNVTIRYVKWEDLDDLLVFANNLIREDTFILLCGNPISRDEEIKYLSGSIAQMEKDQKIHLIATVDGKFAGSTEIRRFEKRKLHVGEVGISLVKEFRGEGIGKEFLQTLIEEGKKMGLKLLILHCFENNDHAIALYKKLGFKPAGIVPGAYAYQNKYIGEVTFYLPLETAS